MTTSYNLRDQFLEYAGPFGKRFIYLRADFEFESFPVCNHSGRHHDDRDSLPGVDTCRNDNDNSSNQHFPPNDCLHLEWVHSDLFRGTDNEPSKDIYHNHGYNIVRRIRTGHIILNNFDHDSAHLGHHWWFLLVADARANLAAIPDPVDPIASPGSLPAVL